MNSIATIVVILLVVIAVVAVVALVRTIGGAGRGVAGPISRPAEPRERVVEREVEPPRTSRVVEREVIREDPDVL